MNGLSCLSTADVILEIEGVGGITTKAIVVDSETDMSYYILGNETQKIIDKKGEWKTKSLTLFCPAIKQKRNKRKKIVVESKGCVPEQRGGVQLEMDDELTTEE